MKNASEGYCRGLFSLYQRLSKFTVLIRFDLNNEKKKKKYTTDEMKIPDRVKQNKTTVVGSS